MKPLKIVMILVAPGLLFAVAVGVIAKNRRFEGLFEVAVPKAKNSEARIARMIVNRVDLEAKGKLTAQLRRQSEITIEMEKLKN